MARPGRREITIRLIHNGVQPGPPLDEVLIFGMQDKDGAVRAGVPIGAERLRLDCVLEVRRGAEGQPVFHGPCAHGPPDTRFLYLSWRRAGQASYGWRIKMPLAGVGWEMIEAAEAFGRAIEADLIGRRPHQTVPIPWRLGGAAS